MEKKLIKKFDLKMLQEFYTHLNINFIIIYIIHKILTSLKITQIILKIIFSNAFPTNIINFCFFISNSSQHIMMKSSTPEKDKK